MGLFDFFRKKKTDDKVADLDKTVVIPSVSLGDTVLENQQRLENLRNSIAADDDLEKSQDSEEELTRRALEAMGCSEEEITKRLGMSESELSQYYAQLDALKEARINDKNDMEIFKGCVALDVKREKAKGNLQTREAIDEYCREKMIGFKEGTFKYPEDTIKSVRLRIEDSDMVAVLSGDEPKLQKFESESDCINRYKEMIRKADLEKTVVVKL